MSIDTISFSPKAKGWVTRWSWIPDWMIGLNSSLYTFKDGSLYQHDTNATYNNFYGNAPAIVTTGTDTAGTADKLTDSTATFNNGSVLVDDTVVNTTTGDYAVVTAIDSATVLSISENIYSSGDSYRIERNVSKMKLPFNESPYEEKMFKTLSLDSNTTWLADLTTELSNGVIEESYYTLKEGEYHAWIRRDPNTIDIKALSTQGIGTLDSFSVDTLTFTFNVSTPISIGDKLYIHNTGTDSLDLIGTITAWTAWDGTNVTITVGSVTNSPSPSDFIVLVKDSTAESYGARGSYMTVELTANDTTSIELFSVGTDVFKSYP